MASATVEQFLSPKKLTAHNFPSMMVTERAQLPCGCGCYIGLRLDNHEVASAAYNCSAAHAGLITHFNELLRTSLENPQDRPLADVIAELLTQAEAESQSEVQERDVT